MGTKIEDKYFQNDREREIICHVTQQNYIPPVSHCTVSGLRDRLCCRNHFLSSVPTRDVICCDWSGHWKCCSLFSHPPLLLIFLLLLSTLPSSFSLSPPHSPPPPLLLPLLILLLLLSSYPSTFHSSSSSYSYSSSLFSSSSSFPISSFTSLFN